MAIILIVSFAIAILSGLGVGSGGLLVIYLVNFTDTPQITAQGINLLFFLFAAAASSAVNIKTKHIFRRTVLIMSAGGVAGCFLGSYLADALGNELLKKIFGAMLTLSGTVSVTKMILERKKKDRS